jgi:transposase
LSLPRRLHAVRMRFQLCVCDIGNALEIPDTGGCLRPRRSQSDDSDPQLGITKAGNGCLRQLLVECANHVIGPHGKDSTLRRWGLSLGARGGSARACYPFRCDYLKFGLLIGE